uniref:Neur_chan_LBD domain-containing protein n=1 Tax=Steinernema glaseri TaxID=37863 RepID=A0A1I7ZEX3_9BILA
MYLENADHSSIVVITSIYINSVKWETNSAEVDLYLREQWMDSRLKYDVDVREQIQEVMVPGNRKIWKPDTYFSNGKELAVEGKQSAVIEPSGYVRSSEGRTVIVPIEYQSKFPFLNALSFTLRLSSYNYALEDVAYLWANSPPNAVALEVSGQLLNSEYSFQEAVAGDCVGNYSVGVYSCIDVVVSFETSCAKTLLSVFLPTILLVIASFLHFWIHGSWSVPRSFSAGFPFLILASLFVFAPNSTFFVSPGVRVWTIFCLIITFFSFLEYFLVICCGIRRTVKYTNGIATQEQNALTSAQETVELAYNTKCANFRDNNGLDIISRVLFPLVFIVFIIVYLVLYLI